MVFADPPIDEATTASVDSTCFRQVEFAGVLRGTEHTDEARQLVDFLVSSPFQSSLPLNLFVYPANSTVALPEVFTANATVPADAGDDGPGDDRRQPPDVARRRGPTRCCAERRPPPSANRLASAGSSSALVAVPVAFLVVFYAWPFAELLARGLRPSAIADIARPVVDVADGVVHAVAGVGQHGG